LVPDGRGHEKDWPTGQRCEAVAGADPQTCADARGPPFSVTEGGRGEKLARETARAPEVGVHVFLGCEIECLPLAAANNGATREGRAWMTTVG
jgi:hypothetical protein